MKYYSMYSVYCVYIESPVSKILKALQGGWMVYEILQYVFCVLCVYRKPYIEDIESSTRGLDGI